MDGEVTPSKESEPHLPIYKNGRYQNPWETFREAPLRKMLRWFILDKNNSNVPSQAVLDKSLPIVPVNHEELKSPPTSGVRVLWLGHASTLVQFDGVTLLTDPVFSDRCGLKSKIGIKRYRDCPATVESLPEVDAVVISHNHYDHLDSATVDNLNKRFGEGLKWFVPMGLKSWLMGSGCRNVEELTWWEESTFKAPGGDEVVFACTPCQHWSNRGLHDRFKTLWSSWAIKGPRHSFFFAGDTGYCSAFKEIGRRYGPFTAAAIPIGAYLPRDCVAWMHVEPAESVMIHNDVKAGASVGIHWGTFVLTNEHYLDPPCRLKKALEDAGMKEDSFVTMKHGEARVFQQETTID